MDRTTHHMKLAAWQELQEALQLKKINEELLEYLGSSLRWLLYYSRKYNINLPEADKISQIIDRTLAITDQIPNSNLPPTFKHPNKTPEESTEPKYLFIFIFSYF